MGYEPVVCCRGATGAPVRRPLPADYPATPVDDTDVPCPACGAIDYEERIPTEHRRGGTPGPNGLTIPTPIVVCRSCGHEERQGVFYAVGVGGEDDEDEVAHEARVGRGREHARVRRWYSDTMTLRALTFPVYAAEGWPAVIGGSGSHGDRLTSLTIDHHDTPDADPYAGDRARFEITTSREDSRVNDELRQARWTLHGWLANNDDDARSSWPEASPAAVSLWLAARERAVRAKVLAAVRSEQLISIDGTRKPFLALTAASGHWVAVRHHSDLEITVAAGDLDPGLITIEPIADRRSPTPPPACSVPGRQAPTSGPNSLTPEPERARTAHARTVATCIAPTTSEPKERRSGNPTATCGALLPRRQFGTEAETAAREHKSQSCEGAREPRWAPRITGSRRDRRLSPHPQANDTRIGLEEPSAVESTVANAVLCRYRHNTFHAERLVMPSRVSASRDSSCSAGFWCFGW